MSVNQYSFDHVYRSYYAALLKVIMHKISSLETAEDVLQEAFIKIWKALPTYSPEKGSIYTWMAAICSHTALDLIKSNQYKRQGVTDEIEAQLTRVDTEHFCLINTDRLDLRCHLSGLRKPCEEALLLYNSGYTHQEIGHLLGIPLGTVKSRIRTGLVFLRKRW